VRRAQGKEAADAVEVERPVARDYCVVDAEASKPAASRSICRRIRRAQALGGQALLLEEGEHRGRQR
jgi:hypothetical protein